MRVYRTFKKMYLNVVPQYFSSIKHHTQLKITHSITKIADAFLKVEAKLDIFISIIQIHKQLKNQKLRLNILAQHLFPLVLEALVGVNFSEINSQKMQTYLQGETGVPNIKIPICNFY